MQLLLTCLPIEEINCCAFIWRQFFGEHVFLPFYHIFDVGQVKAVDYHRVRLSLMWIQNIVEEHLEFAKKKVALS